MDSSTKISRGPLVASGVLGLTGVALGALGAHALEAFLVEHGTARAWDTAARYQMYQALALLGVGLWAQIATGATRSLALWAGRCWCAGIVLFSGSLYAIALGGPRWLGPVTPLGGLFLLAGWTCVIVAACRKEA